MKQPKFTFKDFQTILAVTLLGLFFAAGLVALNWWLAGQYGAGAEFLPAWNGSRAFLFEDTDPYSRTVSEKTQLELYGRAAREGEFPYALDVPFPLLVFYLSPLFIYRLLSLLISFLPFSVPSLPMPDSGWILWIRAVWMTLSELGLTLLAVFALRLADWRPNRWFSFLLLFFSLTWFYSAAALLDGSLSVLLTLALVGALVAMRDFNDELAGFLLAISAMKWEVTLLLWLLIVIGAYSSKRWRVFIGIAMTWFVLGVITFLLYPDWFWPWMRAVAANWRADELLTPALFFQKWFPDTGAALWLLIESVLLLLILLEWFSALRGKDFRRVAWVAALAIAATPLLGFSTTFANLAPLVFSFAFILPFAWERWEKRPYLVISLILLVFFAFPLILRWPTIAADGLAFLLPPLLTILGLYWIRWYVVRPPRTWLDGVKRELQK